MNFSLFTKLSTIVIALGAVTVLSGCTVDDNYSPYGAPGGSSAAPPSTVRTTYNPPQRGQVAPQGSNHSPYGAPGGSNAAPPSSY